MNNDNDIRNPTAPLPQMIFADNDTQNVSYEWSYTPNDDYMSSIFGEDFLALDHPVASQEELTPSLFEVLENELRLDNMDQSTIYDLVASNNQSMVQSSPQNDLSASHSFHSVPASSSQSIIQTLPSSNFMPSAPNDFSCATTLQFSTAESSQSMIESSPSYNFVSTAPNDFINATSFQPSSASSNQSLIQSSPSYNFVSSASNDFSCASSFQTSPASSSQSMIQSPSSYNLVPSASNQSSPASSSQSMLQSPASFNLEPLLQQQEYDNSETVLDICIQPENTFRFRYKSEIKDPHGYLRGASSVGSNLRKHTTIDLRLPKFYHAFEEGAKFFVRCTLHQAASSALIHAPLSPHELIRRHGGKFYDETELFALRKVAQNFYSFELDNFLMTLTPIDQCQKNCLAKLEKLNQSNTALGSKLVLNVAGEDLEEVHTEKKKKKKQPSKPIQVQIAFEVFRCINDEYTSIAGPKFSNIITHGEQLNITKICNLYVPKDELSEVTLLIAGLKNTDIKLHIQECGNTTNPWRQCIDVNKKMIFQKSAITFNMPKYNGNQKQLANIECNIHLERLCDGARSNTRSIFLTNGLKRCRPSGNATITTISANRPRMEEHSIVTPNSLYLRADAVPFTDTPTTKLDSKKHECQSRTEFDYEQWLSSELDLGCGLIDIRYEPFEQEEQIVNEPENTRHSNTEFISFLCGIRKLYNESKNRTGLSKKQDYARRVRKYFLAYEREHPEGNSILHDILADTELKEYEIVLYKIIEHFELEDIVSVSRNIYGETALMFACIFKRPLLIRTLINMDTSIAAQDVENGNNVLHIAMQQQTEDCQTDLIQAMKMGKNAASFIEALGGYNVRGLTPLHVAVLQNNVPIVAELLQFCKKQNAFETCYLGQLSDGNTILHLAVLKRFEAMRACILEHAGDGFNNLMNYANQTAEEIKLDMDKVLVTQLQEDFERIRVTD